MLWHEKRTCAALYLWEQCIQKFVVWEPPDLAINLIFTFSQEAVIVAVTLIRAATAEKTLIKAISDWKKIQV